MKNQKIILAGCGGFVGYSLCDRLLKRGDTVVGIDNLTESYGTEVKMRRITKLLNFKNFTFVRDDITNPEIINKIPIGNWDIFINFATENFYYMEKEKIEYTLYIKASVVGNSVAMGIAKKLSVKKYIYGSAKSVYGKTKKDIYTEKNIVLNPLSPVGSASLAGEKVVEYLSTFYDIPAISLRFFSVYGPELNPHTIVYGALQSIYYDRPVILYGDKGTVRDYLYIEEALNYITNCFNKRFKYQAINIASGKGYTLERVINAIAKEMGKKNVKMVRSKDKDYSALTSDYIKGDISKAQKMLKYTSSIELEEGIKKTVSWYLDNQIYKYPHR